ncbi:MAG: hypothetical protein ABW185_18890 [Sedimenticola sp.]
MDAAFSRIAEKLRRNDAETIPEILDLLPNPGLVETMFDVREWLSPMINVVQKHTQPLHFKIQRTGSDIKAYYKGQQDKPWELMDNTFMDVTPAQNSKPKLVKPTVESINFERLDKQMKQLTLFFKSKDSLKWWCEFVKEKGLKSKTSKWILNDLPHQPVRADAATTSDVPIELRQMIDDERANPTVIMLKRLNLRKISN